jgi:hypothetical protein
VKLLQNMDLYKGVIFGSLLLLPVAGWWIKKTLDDIDVADRAVTAAIKPGGYIEEIGKLQQQIEKVEENRVSASAQTGSTDLYFEGQIFISAAKNPIDKNQFKINPPREEGVTSGKQLARDYIVKIDWLKQGDKEFAFSKEFLFAVLFNCESGATNSGVKDLSSIWKLYSLSVVNAGLERLQLKTPPEQTEDQWIVKKMEFARREPRKDRQ